MKRSGLSYLETEDPNSCLISNEPSGCSIWYSHSALNEYWSLLRHCSVSIGKGKGNVLSITGHEDPVGEQMYSYTLPSTSALDVRGLSTPRPGRFTSRKDPVPIYRRLGGPQGRSGRVRKISPPTGFDPRTAQVFILTDAMVECIASDFEEVSLFFGRFTLKNMIQLRFYQTSYLFTSLHGATRPKDITVVFPNSWRICWPSELT